MEKFGSRKAASLLKMPEISRYESIPLNKRNVLVVGYISGVRRKRLVNDAGKFWPSSNDSDL